MAGRNVESTSSPPLSSPPSIIIPSPIAQRDARRDRTSDRRGPDTRRAAETLDDWTDEEDSGDDEMQPGGWGGGASGRVGMGRSGLQSGNVSGRRGRRASRQIGEPGTPSMVEAGRLRLPALVSTTADAVQ